MRAQTAALILTFALAVTASGFTLWAVVADAPWEDDVSVPIVADNTDEIRCEGALRLREAVVEASQSAPRGIIAFSRDAEDQLAKAEREIDRYC